MNCIDLQSISCNGCGLCANVCPTNAIEMVYDDEGFLVPSINISNCAECGNCVKACDASMTQIHNKHDPIQVQACQTKDKMWAVESTAGGFFPTLAQYVIENDGVVFGTAYSSEMEAVVCKAVTIEEIKRFNGSKYVQSNLNNAFHDVKKELESGKTVLFSGTPCQIAAIKAFLNDINTEKLITVDVICYGVPSPGLFKSYLQTIEEKKHSKIIDFRFRDKHKFGWSHTTVVTLQDRKGNIKQCIEKDYRKVPYYRMFGKRNCYRKACYSCGYNTTGRITDFTTGNFWGIDKLTTGFNSYLGVSMVLINTEKGKEIYRALSDRLVTTEMSLDQAIKANDALVHTCHYPSERDDIYRYYQKYGFSKMYKKYYSINYYKVAKAFISKMIHRS